jgi:DNA processing protein
VKHNIEDLILLNLAGIGYIRLESIIEHFASLEGAIKAGRSALQKIEGIGPLVAEKICSLKNREALKREDELVRKHGVTVFSVFDDEYPENLKNIYDPPIVLYVKGKLRAQDRSAIALVGSRKASVYGIDTCMRLSESLAELNLTVVSGLARGIDSAAHRGALLAAGRTIAVLGNGLSSIYPSENRKLADEIADRGAVMSEFPMGMPPMPQNFPMRNRVISGLSLGTVIVEAAEKSGALITASCALEQGRDVFAVPGKAGTITSAGTHRLIKNGAKLVDGVKDIIEELNLDLKTPAKTSARGGTGVLNIELDDIEKRIYGIVSDGPLHIDTIIYRSRLSAPEAMKHLLRLEVKRLVRELPGKNFISAK